MSSEEYFAVALSRVPSIGAGLYRTLLAHFGSARDTLAASVRELRAVRGIATQTAAHFAGDRHLREAEDILRHAERHAVRILHADGEDYPPALREFASAPAVLYHRGTTKFGNPRPLAVVGTRRMSEQGTRQIERLLDPLVPYAPLVVSGLAYGVDVAAHRRALNLGLPTLGVLGSGLDHIYPHAHQAIARRMAERGGGVLTEYPYWQKPEREHFPARNRIVAMLSQLVVVVESGESGGSIITANMAHAYGRKVGACPGRGGDVRTAGCNALIKAGKAYLVEGAEDLVNLLNWAPDGSGDRQLQLFEGLTAEEKRVVDHLREGGQLSLDQLIRQVAVPPAHLSGLLLGLEMRDVVAALPGHRYRLASG
ncbi:DNA-processing protein DprA [Lewinella sp. IMCC34183]|uniref:DNA-processing protein DprA n=1 Tax=Lewinella sp. IMCC34183 TaxID=2248762 RepID=UPI000E284489|nr:DNA-processing protein DprA [Lewinella sp. IMCC34183]